MAMGILGADSNTAPSRVVGGSSLLSLMTAQLGKAPVFWGRYFKGPGDASSVQYQAATESAFFRAHDLKLLPFARQTTRVSGSRQSGQDDAVQNVEAFLQALTVEHLVTQGGEGTDGATGKEFLMFLDVEPEHPLSSEYYDGWATMLETHSRSESDDQITLLPGVYMNFGDETTSAALMNADADGVPCYGVHVARYFSANPFRARPWDDATVGPKGEIPCETVLWQYFGDFHTYIDGNQINPDPDLSAFVLDRLCVP